MTHPDFAKLDTNCADPRELLVSDFQLVGGSPMAIGRLIPYPRRTEKCSSRYGGSRTFTAVNRKRSSGAQPYRSAISLESTDPGFVADPCDL